MSAMFVLQRIRQWLHPRQHATIASTPDPRCPVSGKAAPTVSHVELLCQVTLLQAERAQDEQAAQWPAGWAVEWAKFASRITAGDTLWAMQSTPGPTQPRQGYIVLRHNAPYAEYWCCNTTTEP